MENKRDNLYSEKTVGVVLYDGCIFFEVALALKLVAEKFKIVALTPDGSIHHASNGLQFSNTTPYKDLDVSSCAGLLVPGGDPESIVENKDVMAMIQKVHSSKKAIAAICAGPSILGMAGILKGRRIAHGYQQEQIDFLKEIFHGVELTNESLVHDGNILTAKPSHHIDFAVEFANRLGIVPDDSISQFKNYYKGI